MPTGFRMKKNLSTDRKLSGNGRARGRESDSRNNDSDGEIYRRVRNRGDKGSFDSKKRKVVDGGSEMRVHGRRPHDKDGRKPNFEEDGARRHGGRDSYRSGGQDSYRSGGRDSLIWKDNNGNGGMRVTKPSYGSQRRFDEDFGVEKRGGRDSYRSEGRDSTLNAPDDRKKTGKPPKWKLGKPDKEVFEVEQGNGEPRGKKDGTRRNEGRDSSVQVRSGKPELKGRMRDDVVSDKREGDADSEKYVKGKERKKTDGRNKSSGDVRAETDPPPRKRKRIKTDRYDLSNKKLEDSVSSDEKTEKDTEEEIKVSLNAQFRAIAPHPSILSFVEDNLLGRRRLNELQKAGYNIKISAPLDNNPFSTNPERDRIEENVFRNKLEFFAAAKISTSFPPPLIPEIAFAGRSNVGKSSLLNALTRQWGVVRTSDKPGLTQSINFFRLSSKICLVDLPGYGFAYAKEEVKDSWEELVKEYVSTRVGLQRVCLLIDTKWGMKPRDKELIELMERHETPYQIVLTKTDIVFPIDVARRAMQIHESLKANKSIVKPVMMVSSQSGAGIRTLRSVLSKLTRFIKP